MSFRIHTADPRYVTTAIVTVADVDASYGYEHVETDSNKEVLILTDNGNQEALVLTGDREDWFRLAHDILAIL